MFARTAVQPLVIARERQRPSKLVKISRCARKDRGFARKDRGFARKDRGFARKDRGFARKDRGFARKDSATRVRAVAWLWYHW
ncbi:hypothetical protein Cagg_2601 [Chloroflexus aggregans DSM 9485]|uniref:Uncharacterized protein n=1 Tax=Chloroflexus aggregans (strain MD-66 / DSM 9485) TaxID=326427 RepID=B8G4J4_CHLAD|nr:hypothetical protein Cagg_2601 [Chloroflexus aggregans DSM 9485]